MLPIENKINFRLLFESLPGSYIVVLPDFTIASVSDDFQTAFMLKREDIIHQSIFTIFLNTPEADMYGAISNLQLSLSSVTKLKTPKTIPAQRHDVQSADGNIKEKYWSWTNKPVLNSENEIECIILHINDITEFMLVQKEQEASEQETEGLQIQAAQIKTLNLALQNSIIEKSKEIVTLNKNISIYKLMSDSACMVAITDTNGIIRDVNENLCRVSKYSKEELVGHHFSIFDSNFHSNDFMENMISTIKEGNIWKGEVRDRAKDNSVFWMNTTIIPFLDERGQPTKYLTVQHNITDQKNAIEALTVSEGNYRDFFENSLVPMFTVDMTTLKNLSVNDKGVELFGYQSKQDFLDNYDPLVHYVNPDDRNEILEKLKISGKIEKGTVEFKKLDGTHFWINYYLKLNIEKKTAETIIIDITEQVKFQRELLASEEKYKTIFENSEVAIYSFDLDKLKLIEVNEKGVQLSGYKSKKEMLENFKPDDHYVNIDDRTRNLENLKKYGQINNELLELKKIDGTHHWASVFMKIDLKNNLLQTILLETTQQVLHQQALKTSEEKHRNIYENSLVAMHTTNIQSQKKIEVNDLCVELFGYESRKDFLDNYDSKNHFVRPLDKENMLATLLKKGEIKNGQYEMKKLNGKNFWAKVFIKLNTEKKIYQTLLIDITSQIKNKENLEIKVKERTVELTKMLEREQGISEMKSRFLTMASHEFRTPLSSILSSIYLIQMYNETEQQEKRVTHINRIASSVKDLTDILNNFLSLEKLKKGILDVNTSSFNLPETLNNIIAEMDGMVNKKNQRISYSHNGETMIEQSEKVLKNIMLNLLSNASKYSGDDSEILLTSSVFKNQVIISVKDMGMGIPEEDHQNLFNEFFRAGNVNNIHGTGLGLCIVKKYTELIDGKIGFISKLNEGSTFSIQLPKKLIHTAAFL